MAGGQAVVAEVVGDLLDGLDPVQGFWRGPVQVLEVDRVFDPVALVDAGEVEEDGRADGLASGRCFASGGWRGGA